MLSLRKLFKNYAPVSSLWLALFTLTGCSTEESENVQTENIYLFADIAVDESLNARIRVDLRDGSIIGRPIELSGQDKISLNFNQTNIQLKKDNDLLGVDYEGTFDTQGQDGVFNFRFSRGNGDVVTVSAYLGMPFEIISPSSGDVFRSDDAFIDVTWNNHQIIPEMVLRATLACLTIEDDGSTEIDHENETYYLNENGFGIFPLYELIFNLILEITIEDEEIVPTEPCDLHFSLAKSDRKELTQFARASAILVEQIRTSSTFKVIGVDSK